MFKSKGNWPLRVLCLSLLYQLSGSDCPIAYACGLGKYSYAGQTMCTDCPRGHKCPSTATPVPVACVPGEYQSLSGMSACEPCPAGSYCPSAGLSVATECGLGKYSYAGQTSCTDCPQGHKCPSTTTSAPVACAPGECQSLAGMSSCYSCPVDNACPSTSTTHIARAAGSDQSSTTPISRSNSPGEENELLLGGVVLMEQSPCNLTNKDVLSAIERAKTAECKKKIATIGCALLQPDFYPRSLPRYCPLKNDKEKLTFVGCFRDSVGDRDIDGAMVDLHEKNSPELCVEWCYRSGFNYAGLQYQRECWCGNTYGKHGAADSKECNMSCPGLNTATCGGHLVQSVYKTGFGRTANNRVYLPVFNEASPSVRVAFMLLLNGRSDRQVKRLLSLIYRRQHFYLLHVDARQDFLRRQLERLLEERPLLKHNVRLVDYGIAPIWGGTSMLTVMLRAIRELLEWSNEWDFVLNLSETDLPVKSVDDLSAFLAEYKGKNFLYTSPFNTPEYISGTAYDQTFFECEHRIWRLGRRELVDGIHIVGGSNWNILDRKFANYSAYSNDDLIVGLKRVSQYTRDSPETFFHMLLHNSEFCSTHVEHNLKLIYWVPKRGCNCQMQHVSDFCGCSPNDFSTTQADRLLHLDKEPFFFARKFESVVYNHIVDQVVDKVLNSRVPTGETQDGGYFWHNEYDWLDRRPPDDATMALYQSWTRLAPKWLEMLSQCSPGKMNLRRIEQVRHDDMLKGIATAFELDVTDADGGNNHGSPAVQILWTARPFKRITSAKASTLLKTLDVGSNFDLKEQIVRDVAAAFGPHSSLTAVAHMRPISVRSILTFVWLDSEGSLAHLNEMNLSTLNAELMVNVSLTRFDPLMAGSWTLQLYLNQEMIAERVFVVLPIGSLVKSPPRYNATALDWLAASLKPPHHRDVPSNATEWTDKLVRSLWTVQAICAIGSMPEECTVNACATTEWSAISSDPHRWFDKALAEKTKD